MASLTEGQIQVNIIPTHKPGEIKSKGEVKRLKPGESESQHCNAWSGKRMWHLELRVRTHKRTGGN